MIIHLTLLLPKYTLAYHILFTLSDKHYLKDFIGINFTKKEPQQYFSCIYAIFFVPLRAKYTFMSISNSV